jgi:hypothetical protein
MLLKHNDYSITSLNVDDESEIKVSHSQGLNPTIVPLSSLPIPATYAIITTCPVCLGVNQERIQCNCANDSIGAHWCAQAAVLPCGGD